MNTLKDYRSISRGEVAYLHLCSMIIIFKSELVKMVIGDNGVSCDLKSLNSDRIFTQIYYFANISDRYKFTELVSEDDELKKDIEVEAVHKRF